MNTSFDRLRGGQPAIGPVRDGARAMAPWLVGIAPLGFVIGVTTARADIPAGAGWLAGPLIFSASAQAVTIQLLDAHAAALVVIAGGLAVNLRLVLYSAAMARHWRARPAWWNALAAYTLVDPSAAVALEGYERSDDACLRPRALRRRGGHVGDRLAGVDRARRDARRRAPSRVAARARDPAVLGGPAPAARGRRHEPNAQ